MGFELIAASDWSEFLGGSLNLLKVAVGLGFVIFVHELGHFLVAKLCGVKCEKFYIGFDIPMPLGIPSKLLRFQWGETEYGIGILPLGGYVKMLGQDDNPLNAEQEAERTRMLAESSSGVTAGSVPPPQRVLLDPRSYTAKSVPQRMAIISAGVIVNLVFAVIFAACAYNMGVPTTPCEIGHVIPGGPAWKAGLAADTRIVQIGDNGKRSDMLRFDWDLRQGVGLHGDQADLPLFVRDDAGQVTRVLVRPATFKRGWEKLSSIGITAAETLELRAKDPENDAPAISGSAAAQASPSLKDGDRVTGVDGQAVSDPYQLTAYLAQHADQPVTLQVNRPAGAPASASQTVSVTVPPQRRRQLGTIMVHGSITAIRPNSPAARAGFREGDTLLTINSEPLGDPMLLPDKVRPWYGREIEMTVARPGEAEPVTLRVTPVAPTTFDWDWSGMPRAPMSSEALGLAFTVSSVIKEVVPGSPADQAGLKSGDKLVGLQIQPKSQNPASKGKAATDDGDKIPIDGELVTWPSVTQLLQYVDSEELVVLHYERGNSGGTATMSPVVSDVFQPDRGLLFASHSETLRAASVGEAISLGLRLTWEDATRVVGLLRKLINGSVSVTNLGGLGTIAYVATGEASEGVTRLLIFLTMLSANLAVLNFLPIPALDGGHMVFLIYEGLFRKPVNERVQVALTIFGVVCLLGLMIFVNAMDVRRFFF